jgi:hypothetical protein
MERVDPASKRLKASTLSHLGTAGLTTHNDVPPSPVSSTGTPVFVTATPGNATPHSSSMSGIAPHMPEIVTLIDSWIAVTPESSDDEHPFGRTHSPLTPIITQDLAIAVEGLRIHEHEESFPSEGEDDDEEDISIPPSEDSSLEDNGAESSDEETILAPRTAASLAHHVISDEALRARFALTLMYINHSLSTLLKNKDALEDFASPRRIIAQGPTGMETLSLVSPEEFVTRASVASSRASSKSNSRLGRKSHSKRGSRSPPKVPSKERQAQIYALWTAAITAGFLVGFGAGYAWKEYLVGGGGSEDVRQVGCTWCGEGKR